LEGLAVLLVVTVARVVARDDVGVEVGPLLPLPELVPGMH